MSDTYSYEVLEPGGHARLVGNVLDRISSASANPASAVGSSRAVLGDAETASWMERTTAADGAALIEAVYGNTVVESGSLLPVRMEGIETVGFNQWDEQWELGYIGVSDGQAKAATDKIRSKNYTSVIGGTRYYINASYATCACYDSEKSYIGNVPYVSAGNNQYYLDMPQGARFIRFNMPTAYGTTYKNDICINLSDTSRNGTYEPHWSSTLAIPATDLRGLPDGTCDELTNNALVRRVGSINIAASDWHATGASMTYGDQYETTLTTPAVSGTQGYDNSRCDVYDNTSITTANQPVNTIRRSNNGLKAFVVVATGTTPSACEFIYPLATPTTTPIDPPLPMSYRVGAGGTERVMVASGTTSAPPIFVTRYPLDPADLAASIAPVDGPTAKTNHQVGDLIMLGFTLCKATQVIVTGETIEIGTNVTQTSVAAEIAALSE